MPLNSTHNRCNFPGCDHPDDEDLLTCESCSGKVCGSHHSNRLCGACRQAERAALKIAAQRLQLLTIRMLAGKISAGTAAEQSLSIMDELECWDLGIERMAVSA